MSLFRCWPVTDPLVIIRKIIEAPYVFGKGWKVIGINKNNEVFNPPFNILLASPSGSAVPCIIDGIIDEHLISKAKKSVDFTEELLPVLNTLKLDIPSHLIDVKGFIIGGRLAPEILPLDDQRLSIFTFSVVPNQPGPPYLISEPHIANTSLDKQYMDDEVWFNQSEINKLVI